MQARGQPRLNSETVPKTLRETKEKSKGRELNSSAPLATGQELLAMVVDSCHSVGAETFPSLPGVLWTVLVQMVGVLRPYDYLNVDAHYKLILDAQKPRSSVESLPSKCRPICSLL